LTADSVAGPSHGTLRALELIYERIESPTAKVLRAVVGKPVGIVAGAWIAVRLKAAAKPEEYSWRQLAGAGAFGGIGFTMSLFIAAQAYPDDAQCIAAKVAIFMASLLAAVTGVLILLKKERTGGTAG
jgi:NhaA family Na+:H+ antiporter